MNREELDDKEKRVEEDSFQLLSEAFNDYVRYKYQNITFSTTSNGILLPNPDMKLAYEECKHLNPCDSLAPPRDGGWIKSNLSSLRSQYTLIYEKWGQSGHHDIISCWS